MISRDYEDLFSTLNTYKVKYLVIGAHAVMFYSEPRFTKDIDLWIPSALNDSRRVHEALRAFGAPLTGIAPKHLEDPKMILQIGVAPVRVDILAALPGVSAQESWRHRKRSRYGKTPINVLGLAELIKVKSATGRSQDKLDLVRLLRNRKTR